MNRFFWRNGWLLLFPLQLFSIIHGYPQGIDPSKAWEETYKQDSNYKLNLTIFPSSKTNGISPAIVFFFGGGWINGSIEQFQPHAEYFASRGIVAILSDYRIRSKHGSTPFEAVEDARDAMRFIRSHAKDWGIDPNRICAAGGSAGGHLAAVTAIKPATEDPEAVIKAKPNALILFNPVIDNGPNGYGYDRLGQRFEEISPLHNIKAGMPPTLFFLGTQDRLIPVATAESYCERLQAVGSRCDLHLYAGQGHGFFNYRNEKYYRETVYTADQFLNSLGYLDGPPTLLPLEFQLSQPLPHAHAHNDYRQQRPLSDALQHGFTSVEADLLPHNGELFVGHDRIELDGHAPLFEELYLKPLFRRFNYYQGEIFPDYQGSFYLWLDIKFDGALVYPLLKEMIIPYHEMLTSWTGDQLRPGKVTLILSGDRPFDQVEQDTSRWLFLDGRPDDIGGGYDSRIMPFISAHYTRVFRMIDGRPEHGAEAALADFANQCHEEGKRTRLWATPEDTKVWDLLLRAELDLINTDSLPKLSSYLSQR